MLMMLVIFAPNYNGQVDVESFDDNDGDGDDGDIDAGIRKQNLGEG